MRQIITDDHLCHLCLSVSLRAHGLTVAILTDFNETWHRRLESEAKEPFRWGQNPIRESPTYISTQFTQYWHLYNALSTGVLKYLSDVPCRPIITSQLHSSNGATENAELDIARPYRRVDIAWPDNAAPYRRGGQRETVWSGAALSGHKFLVVTVEKIVKIGCTFTEVIAKLKLGYHFFWTTRYITITVRLRSY